jgi:hypothetical protein
MGGVAPSPIEWVELVEPAKPQGYFRSARAAVYKDVHALGWAFDHVLSFESAPPPGDTVYTPVSVLVTTEGHLQIPAGGIRSWSRPTGPEVPAYALAVGMGLTLMAALTAG